MDKKGQSGVIIIVIVIIVIGILFLYHEGYFSAKTSITTTKQNVNPYLPISFNISSTNNLAHLYTNQNINIISSLVNSGNEPINLILSPYGCSFLPIQNKSVSIPAGSSTSLQWTFSGSNPTTCSITLLACFNAVSYTNYPLTIESYKFTGKAPSSASTASSGLPIDLFLQSFNSTIVAGPSPVNNTEYIYGYALTSTGSTSRLNWVSISINNGKGYFTTSTGKTLEINPNINITNSQYPLTFEHGKLLAPVSFSLLVQPVSNSLGYYTGAAINVSAGYTYCLTSNSIPITLHSS